MNPAQRYLQNAKAQAHEEWAGVDGFIDEDLHFTADERFMGVDASQAPAQAQPAQMGMGGYRKSQPYVVTVSNASAATVNNFDIWNAYQYLGNSFSGGSLTISGITLSGGLSNVNYYNMLFQSQASPFTVGGMYILSTSGSASQINQTMSVITTDMNGNQATKAVLPLTDPYQQQTTSLWYSTPFRIDGFTALRIATVLPSVVFSIYFFPSDNLNLARGLAGNNVGNSYGKPGIIRESVAVVPGTGSSVVSRVGA